MDIWGLNLEEHVVGCMDIWGLNLEEYEHVVGCMDIWGLNLEEYKHVGWRPLHVKAFMLAEVYGPFICLTTEENEVSNVEIQKCCALCG